MMVPNREALSWHIPRSQMMAGENVDAKIDLEQIQSETGWEDTI